MQPAALTATSPHAMKPVALKDMPFFVRRRRSERATAKNAVAFVPAIVNHAAPLATARSPKPRKEEGSVKSQMTMAVRRFGSQIVLGSMLALAACATPPRDP